MFSFSRVRLHQNFCFYSCVSTSKCFPILACIQFKIFGFTRVRLHQNVSQLWFALNQNVFLFSCAPTSNFFPVLVFAYIENNVSLFLCASVSEGLLLLMSTFVFSLCNYSNVPLCVSFDFVFLHGL